MLIQEEYARRHKLPMALVGHTLKEGTALLRDEGSRRQLSSSKHLILKVNWVPHDRHPGTYQVGLLRPIHDSHSKRDMFFAPATDHSVFQYEELDAALLSLGKDPGIKAVISEKDTLSFMWEMFVCCFDGWLVRNASTKMLGHTEGSIDPLLSEDDRYDHLQAAIATMSFDNPSVYEKWNVAFNGMRRRLTPWLANVINGE